MEPTSVGNFRYGRSPTSDRFFGVFSPPSSDYLSGGTSGTDDELNEDDVFWTSDVAETKHRTESPSVVSVGKQKVQNHHIQSFRRTEKYGILAALMEDSKKLSRPVLYRKPSISTSSSPMAVASRVIPAIPKPPQEREYSHSVPFKKFQQSVPVNVPLLPKKVRNVGELVDDVEIDEEEGMLPPHEIVARGSRSPKTTFSVLEGAGRTLKGRDLRQVRNAVWRQTGFLN
ncbi:hypothetical protein LguiA_015921 [Lonicera macranthoides]